MNGNNLFWRLFHLFFLLPFFFLLGEGEWWAHWYDLLILLLFLAAQNNCYTRHLAKILIHLSWCLQECVSTSDASSSAYLQALNAVYVSSVFLKHLIENAKTDNFEDLYMSLNESEEIPSNVHKGNVFAAWLVHWLVGFSYL